MQHRDLWENAVLSCLEAGKTGEEAVRAGNYVVNTLEEHLAQTEKAEAEAWLREEQERLDRVRGDLGNQYHLRPVADEGGPQLPQPCETETPTTSRKWKDAGLLCLVLAVLVVLVFWFPPFPTSSLESSPVEWTGAHIEEEIATLSKAAAWAKEQGIPLVGVRCWSGKRCSAETIGATYHLNCREKCEITGFDYPTQYQNHSLGTGTP